MLLSQHLNGGMIQTTYLGHSTFELQFETGEVLVFDPFIEGNKNFPKDHKFKRIDAIAVSHGHFDHITGVKPLAKEFKPKVVSIFEVSAYLESEGVDNNVGMNKGGTVDLGFAKLTMTHALHSSGIKDGSKILYGGEPAGYILRTPSGKCAYFAGDTSVFGDMALIGELYNPELAFLPIGDFYTMGPFEAAHAAKLLKVKQVVPMHYATFPPLTGSPAELKERLSGTGIEVQAVKPGESFSW